jgi:hypothetical protein
MIFISGVPADRIDEVWNDCSEFIKMGNRKSQNEMSLDDIYWFLKDSEMQLWIVFDEDRDIKAVITTQILNYPQKKVCRIVTLGGSEMENWTADTLQILEEWASEKDCDSMETVCRKGFIKKLKEFGYEQTYVILGKDLKIIH